MISINPYLLAFHQIPKCTHTRLFKISAGSHRDWEMAWKKATVADFVSWGIEEQVALDIICERDKISPETILKKLEKIGAGMLSFFGKEYPVLLKEIADPPFILYVIGNVDILSKTCFAVVGTRMMSSYGKQVIEYFIPPLVHAGFVIVSGLAFGVDAQAHKTTVLSQGETVAVLGSGIDCIYPATHKKLAENIVKNKGVILSDFPLGMRPTMYAFPLRNRIISGISKGVLIIEAKKESGSLITARLALEQNREVFAVPGNIFSENSTGTHNLLKKGEARAVTCVQDILEEFGLSSFDETKKIACSVYFDNEQEEKIYLLLSKEPVYIDSIILQSGYTSAEVNKILTLLEMRGLALDMGGMKWVRR